MMSNTNWLKGAMKSEEISGFYLRNKLPWALETRPYKSEETSGFNDNTETDIIVDAEGHAVGWAVQVIEIKPILNILNSYPKLQSALTKSQERVEELEEGIKSALYILDPDCWDGKESTRNWLKKTLQKALKEGGK